MHTVFRKYAAVLLIMAYAMMLLGQLAPMAMGSATIAHAITGECSGICDIDGCSLESRANHTCCCWQKKQQRAAMTQTAKLDHFNMKPATLPAAPNKSCCPTKSSLPPESTSPCCKNNNHVHDEVTADKPAKNNTNDSQPVYKCGCPCGDSKQLALWGGGKIEWIPFTLSKINIASYEEPYHVFDPARLTSRHGDPPDPPPKITSHA